MLKTKTRKNERGELEWADATRSKAIHVKLKHVVAEVGDTMTQEEILIQVLEPRSLYIRGKGTAMEAFKQDLLRQLEPRIIVEEQGKIQEQEKRIRKPRKTTTRIRGT